MDCNKYDVFISYAQGDLDVAKRISKILREEGLRVFNSEECIQLGEDWTNAITDALENSQSYILLITPESVKSRWTNFELGVITQRSYRSNKLVIPIIVGTVDRNSLLMSIQHRKSIQLSEEDIHIGEPMEKLIKQVGAVINQHVHSRADSSDTYITETSNVGDH